MKNGLDRKEQRGFTLVEVIVVAIIVAALAAVAIPLYNSYITTSKNNAAANAAGSVASFVGACLNQGGAPAGVGNTFTNGDTVSVTCTTNASTIKVPKGIHIKITATKSPGQVVATADTSSTANEQTYSF